MVGRWNFLLYASLSSWCYVSFRQGNSNTKIKVHRARLLCHFAFKKGKLVGSCARYFDRGYITPIQLWESLQVEITKQLLRQSFFSCWENIEKSVFSISKLRQFRSPSFRPRSFTNQNHSPGQDRKFACDVFFIYHLRIWDEVMLCLPLRSRHVEYFKTPLPNMLLETPVIIGGLQLLQLLHSPAWAMPWDMDRIDSHLDPLDQFFFEV